MLPSGSIRAPVPVIPDRCVSLPDRRTVEGESEGDIGEQLEGAILRKKVRCYTGYEEGEAWFSAWLNEDPSLLKLAERLGSGLITGGSCGRFLHGRRTRDPDGRPRRPGDGPQT